MSKSLGTLLDGLQISPPPLLINRIQTTVMEYLDREKASDRIHYKGLLSKIDIFAFQPRILPSRIEDFTRWWTKRKLQEDMLSGVPQVSALFNISNPSDIEYLMPSSPMGPVESNRGILGSCGLTINASKTRVSNFYRYRRCNNSKRIKRSFLITLNRLYTISMVSRRQCQLWGIWMNALLIANTRKTRTRSRIS